MLIVKGNQTINLDNVACFFKFEEPEHKFFTIQFSLTPEMKIIGIFEYDNLKQRDIDYLKIIEAYNHNYRIVDL